ncbi:MAG: tRNA (N6-threonylcarbamoyladenosine(37)-N6)-methyltransferase TrmO [Candidatus Korobacteraceae bacterium]
MDALKDAPVLELRPIGTIQTPFPQPAGAPLQPSRADGAKGTVWIDEPFRPALRDLEGFERIWLLFWFHKAPTGKLLVTPFLDKQERGVFATRAPARINPIGMSAVRLLSVHADHLEVADVDIVDGTPLLDIKPYVPEFDSYASSKAGWFDLSKDQKQFADARFQTDQPLGSSGGVNREKNYKAMTKLRLSIAGMHCERCLGRIRTALKEIPGVSVWTTELGSTFVEFDSKLTTAEAIVNAFGVSGFPATGEIV